MLLAEKSKPGMNKSIVITMILFVMIVLTFIVALNYVSEKSEQQQAAFIESSIHRAVITCFAIEGRYPPSLDYLAEHYGMQSLLENEHYIISYNAFASNIFPDIAVLKVGAE